MLRTVLGRALQALVKDLVLNTWSPVACFSYSWHYENHEMLCEMLCEAEQGFFSAPLLVTKLMMPRIVAHRIALQSLIILLYLTGSDFYSILWSELDLELEEVSVIDLTGQPLP